MSSPPNNPKGHHLDSPAIVYNSLYILELAPRPGTKIPQYYVGSSQSLSMRWAAHWASRGSQFTKAFPPQKVAFVKWNATVHDEKMYTLAIMHLAGYQRCRGGPYSKRYLPRPPRALQDVSQYEYCFPDLGFVVGHDESSSSESIPEIIETSSDDVIVIDIPDYTASRGVEWPIRGVAEAHVGSWRVNTSTAAAQSTTPHSASEGESISRQESSP